MKFILPESVFKDVETFYNDLSSELKARIPFSEFMDMFCETALEVFQEKEFMNGDPDKKPLGILKSGY